MKAFFADVLGIVRPFGLKRLIAVGALGVLQALVQLLAVFSLLPFLSAAADVHAFRASRSGQVVAAMVGNGTDKSVLIGVGLASLGILIFSNAVALAAEYNRARYANYIGNQLRLLLTAGLLRRRYAYFLSVNSSVLLKNLIDDVNGFTQSILLPMIDAVARVVLIVLLVGAMVVVAPMVLLYGVLAITLYYFLVMRTIRKRAGKTSKKIQMNMRALYFEVNQLILSVKPILASDRRTYFIDRVARVSTAVAEEMPKVPLYSAIPRSGLEVMVFGGMIAWVLLAIIAGRNMVEMMPQVGVVAIVAYRLMPSLQLLFGQIGAIAVTRQSMTEVLNLIQDQQNHAVDGQLLLDGTIPSRGAALEWTGKIEFDRVSFVYAGADEPAIRELSFTIDKGEKVAFVGATGSGKSTLIDLMLGLLQPTSGTIRVDGVALATILPSWRAAIGYVPQDLMMLDATISENIAFGFRGDELDIERVMKVAEIAQAREFIEDGRAHAFDAAVGERGTKLSGGQRQRLALARAMYEKPNVLVMDEATSALDPRTEQKVVAAVAKEHDKLTIITVTHRLKTVHDYDRIFYMEAGVIAASGTFEQMSADHEKFRDFVR